MAQHNSGYVVRASGRPILGSAPPVVPSQLNCANRLRAGCSSAVAGRRREAMPAGGRPRVREVKRPGQRTGQDDGAFTLHGLTWHFVTAPSRAAARTRGRARHGVRTTLRHALPVAVPGTTNCRPRSPPVSPRPFCPTCAVPWPRASGAPTGRARQQNTCMLTRLRSRGHSTPYPRRRPGFTQVTCPGPGRRGASNSR